jgi:cytochrome c oxidase subunit 2
MTSFHFQNPVTPMAEGIIHLHHYICLFLIWIGFLVGYMYVYILIDFWYRLNYPKNVMQLERRKMYFLTRKINHYAPLETYWTLIPTVILLFIAVPSFQLLYSMETIFDTFIIAKATGHQWYWNYEITSFPLGTEGVIEAKHDKFDSYMIPENELPLGTKRLLTVDRNVLLPYGLHICVKVTSADVLHSWAVPSLGIKMDAIPGRINQIPLYIKREGIFFGQCSEICGAGHAYMPIVVVSYDPKLTFVLELLSSPRNG